MVYTASKTYGASSGLSCAFRQWRADSHCRFLHGYALSVRIDFEADKLDERGWVVDFGGFSSFKVWLEESFDHKTLIATDDPLLSTFRDLHQAGAIDLVEVSRVGCENFAEMIFRRAEVWLDENGLAPRCRVRLVEVREHEGNAAIYRPGDPGHDALTGRSANA